MSNYILTVKDVSKIYQVGDVKTEVLNNVNLNVIKGDFISIMGPSGSGKSTLLYLMGGLDKVTSGHIYLKDKDISSMKDDEESAMRRKDIGFIFQFYNLIPNLTVAENILLPVLLDGKNQKDYSKKVDEILKIVGLSDRKHHTPRELSGGQQQRVAIARALINDPEVILADEPIGNLDSKTGTEIMNLLKDINKQRGTTIIMVTHSDESAAYGNRTISLRDGKIFAEHAA
ncbi:MAG: Lipoprotein-releasing system ATP-binding protein LolD [Firmicutes bacterium ADurb.Bin419]|nr:MAG: Lipoprotein-releasing system ATP-binding protein LolD [Firmicutes bacterium ADurb.Bin419]